MAERNYTVRRKEEVRRFARGDGELYQAYIIYATSKGGTQFSIEVPLTEIELAHDRLSARARQLDSI